jgi:hypothetical protein
MMNKQQWQQILTTAVVESIRSIFHFVEMLKNSIYSEEKQSGLREQCELSVTFSRGKRFVWVEHKTSAVNGIVVA